MKVRVENVGPFDKKEYSFSKGVNLLKTSNAGGKTTLAKSLLMPFLFPIKSSEMLNEAEILGVYSSNDNQPLLKIGRKKGRIDLDIDSETKGIEISGKKVNYSTYGNERSTICCYMSENSRIVRQMELANPDFEWIPTLLSRAVFYEKVNTHIKNLEEKTAGKLDNLSRLRESYENLEKKKEELENEISELSSQKKEVEQKREELLKEVQEIPTDLKERFTKLQNEKEKLENELNKLREKKKQENKQREKLRSYKKEYELKINDYTKQREKLYSKERSFGDHIDDLKRRIKQLRKETEDLRKEILPEIERIDKEKDNLVEKRGEERKVEEIQTVMLELLRAGRLDEVTCPVCGATNVDKNHIEQNITNVKEKLKNINNQVSNLINNREEIKNKIDRKEEEIQKIEQEIKDKSDEQLKIKYKKEKIDKEVNKLKNEYGNLKNIDQEVELLDSKISGYDRYIDERENKLKETSNEIEKLEEKFAEVETSKSGILQEYSSKLGEIDNNISRDKEEISKIDDKLSGFNVSVEELNDTVSIDTALTYYKEVKSLLRNIRKQLDEEIENQKLGALRRFNKKVGDILSKLQFGFSNVYLQSDYRLFIERNGTEQPLSSLSTAERYSLATIIQRAVKEAYLPEIPIFIVDGTLLSFDPERKPKLLEYLEESARENGEVIVVTEVSNDPNIVIEKLSNYDLVGGS